MSEKIAIVGSGLIGRSWAVLFARGGYSVVLYDVKEELMTQAMEVVEAQLQSLHQSNLLLGWYSFMFCSSKVLHFHVCSP